MYETIEDIDAGETRSAGETGQRRLWVMFAIISGLAVLVAVALFSVKPRSAPLIDPEAIKAEEAAYRTSLTEADPALRRARLTDFLETWPDSSRRGAVQAQLGVLNAAEAEDWAALTDIIFDTELPKANKIFALDRYEEVWSGAVLGGRGGQLDAIREGLSGETEEFPSRDLPIDPDDIPDADVLVGGDGFRDDFEIFPDEDETTPYPQTEDVITPPRLRRNVRPRYPRRAEERGAEALIVLRLFIDERGRVEETELVLSQADRYENDFIRAAERAARRTRYHPKTINGDPVASDEGIIKRYRFQLD